MLSMRNEHKQRRAGMVN